MQSELLAALHLQNRADRLEASIRHADWHPHCDNRAITRPGMEKEGSIHQPGSLVHVQNAQSALEPYPAEVKTRSVIADRKVHRVVLCPQGDMNRRAWCMLKGISERLLGNAVYRSGCFGRQRRYSHQEV
jgi:hypothetical protein